jgi:hypothetical protein
MLDDDQFAQFLADNQLVRPEMMAGLRERAEAQGKPLYLSVIDEQLIPEERLVQTMSQRLNVPSVLLKDFDGDAALLAIIPPVLARSRGILPVGIADQNGYRTLYLATADPWNIDSLEEVGAHTDLPLVPLLAGPYDLQEAIERCYPGDSSGLSSLGADEEIARVLGDIERSDEIEVEIDSMSGIPPERGGDGRHGLASLESAPPSGIPALPRFRRTDNFGAAAPIPRGESTGSAAADSGIAGQTGLGLPVPGRVERPAQRTGSPSNRATVAHDMRPLARSSVAAPDVGSPFAQTPPAVLTRALVSVLVARGLVTEAEITAEIKRLGF